MHANRYNYVQMHIEYIIKPGADTLLTLLTYFTLLHLPRGLARWEVHTDTQLNTHEYTYIVPSYPDHFWGLQTGGGYSLYFTDLLYGIHYMYTKEHKYTRIHINIYNYIIHIKRENNIYIYIYIYT